MDGVYHGIFFFRSFQNLTFIAATISSRDQPWDNKSLLLFFLFLLLPLFLFHSFHSFSSFFNLLLGSISFHFTIFPVYRDMVEMQLHFFLDFAFWNLQLV